MSISIRLDQETESSMRLYLQTEEISLSSFIRDAIREKLERGYESKATPAELGKDLFGKYGSGEHDRSIKRKTRIREKIRAKHRY